VKVEDLKPGTKFYGITAPHVSRGLKRTYNKHLEVYEFIITDDLKVEKGVVYEVKNGKIIEKSSGHAKFSTLHGRTIISEGILHKLVGEKIFFISKDYAFITKLILLEKMKNNYIKELARLNELMNKNCPETESILDDYKNKLPELFI